jgi:hypothetical protein
MPKKVIPKIIKEAFPLLALHTKLFALNNFVGFAHFATFSTV